MISQDGKTLHHNYISFLLPRRPAVVNSQQLYLRPVQSYFLESVFDGQTLAAQLYIGENQVTPESIHLQIPELILQNQHVNTMRKEA
jgi:hypothetical protein